MQEGGGGGSQLGLVLNVEYPVSPYREIGLARNVEVKISKMFQKGIKLKYILKFWYIPQ